jgi:hypothetical protein
MFPLATIAVLASLASADRPDGPLIPEPSLGKRSDPSEEAEERPPAQDPRPGIRLGPRIGGGGVLGSTVSWDLGTGTLMDLGLSLRPAVRDLVWSHSAMLSGGVARELWGRRVKQGIFGSGGSTIPGLPYYESYLAGGYHWRLGTRTGRFGLQLRIGGGVMPYGELDGRAQGVRPMLYLSADPLWLVKEAE